ncbi:MAG: hypothetical protein KIT83_10410 [Bryobacterales bacterium]|nr:hypothetical protein [Bryobacterales bacterium]
MQHLIVACWKQVERPATLCGCATFTKRKGRQGFREDVQLQAQAARGDVPVFDGIEGDVLVAAWVTKVHDSQYRVLVLDAEEERGREIVVVLHQPQLRIAKTALWASPIRYRRAAAASVTKVPLMAILV